ncbi:hypothetical protein HFU84_10790 [Acidithiobacillus sp. CV18-2]|nr:hypothetical protein [Acidithiobacillus sp. CV18-2]
MTVQIFLTAHKIPHTQGCQREKGRFIPMQAWWRADQVNTHGGDLRMIG